VNFFGSPPLQYVELAEKASRSIQEANEYLRKILRSRRRVPKQDLISSLAFAEHQGDCLSEEEILATCQMMVFAGFETTTNLIGNGLLALLTHSGEHSRFSQDPSVLKNAIQEILRFDAPVQRLSRVAKADFNLRGAEIRAGDLMFLMVARRTGTKPDSRIRIDSTSGAMPAGTWPSVTRFTRARATHWPSSKPRSPLASCSAVFPVFRWWTRNRGGKRTSRFARLSVCRSLFIDQGGTAMYARIARAAKYLPERVVTNQDLIDDYGFPKPISWFEPSGVKERRFAAEGESTISMGAEAVRQVFDGMPASDRSVDVMIMTSSSCEISVPGGASTIAHEVGLNPGLTFDLTASCSGFSAAFDVATQYVKNGAERVLIVSAEIASRCTHFGPEGEHHQLAGIFADGAGAVLVEASSEMGVEGSARATLPEYCENVIRHHGSSADFPDVPPGKVLYRGEENIARAFALLPGSVAQRALAAAGVAIEDIRWLVSHQPRMDMLTFLARQLEVPPERHFINVERYGNTSSASLPICLAELIESGLLQRGDRVLMLGMGAGFVACAHVLRY
jgi:3-oxoacyl-(acyl-carrier-protein) synthase III